MTTFSNTAFSFDFAAVSVDDNPIDTFPYDVPLAAEIVDVAYKNLAKKDSGEEKIRLIITQDVHHAGQVGRFETIISPKQAYILKQYLQAAGVDANSLSGQSLDEEALKGALVGVALTLVTTQNEWNGKQYRNFKKAAAYENVDTTDEKDLPF